MSRLLYLRHRHHVQGFFVSTSPQCWRVSSSTCNNHNKQYLEPTFHTLIKKYVSTYGNAYLINMFGYSDVYVNTRNLNRTCISSLCFGECCPPWFMYYLYPLLWQGSSLVTIVITRFVMNTRLICCLPLNTIDEFLVSRLVDVKRVQYKDVTLLRTYYC
jgi:hypothetical protein